MESLTIKGTHRTPDVEFNQDGNLRLSGRSIPEDAGLFYNLLHSWVFQYCMQPAPQSCFTIELEYMNSGSAKCLLQILREFTNLADANQEIAIRWYYEIGDDDMLEKGEYFQSILKQNFEFIETY